MSDENTTLPDFEVFRNKNGRAVMPVGPTLSVSRRGHLTLNVEAFDALGQPDAVELLYDGERRIIGIRVAEPDSDCSYRINNTSHARSFVVSGRAFMRHYAITLDGEVSAMRWPVTMVDGVLCADLTQPGTEVAKGRPSVERLREKRNER